MKRLLEACKLDGKASKANISRSVPASGQTQGDPKKQKKEGYSSEKDKASDETKNEKAVDFKKKGSVMSRIRGQLLTKEEFLGRKTYSKPPCPEFHEIGAECPLGKDCPVGHKPLVKMAENNQKAFNDNHLETKKIGLNRGLKRNPVFMAFHQRKRKV